jgi:DNA invertase Pin-like site-specific DNA recombinase
MLIGYAHVSTQDQTSHLQEDTLTQNRCSQIFTDTVSGSTTERPGLGEALRFLPKGDVLVVWRLDRLGRSLKHLIDTFSWLQARSIGFKSLTESIDTTTPGGKLIFHIFGALAEFERDLIQERTRAGPAAARSRGKRGGRPAALDANQRKLLQTMYADKSTRIADILSTLHISKSTLYRALKSTGPAA